MSSRFLLQTFGGLTLTARDSGEPVLVNQRKRLAFLAALASDANGGVPRERLFALFWPESDGERARNALNQVVFAIRRVLGDDAIVGDAVALRLDPNVVDSDTRNFRAALAEKRFADAITTYRGPFLDGVFLRDTPEFERWADDVRRASASEYTRALERATNAALDARPPRAGDAVRYAELAATHDPLSTRVAVRFMRALRNAGDTAAALRHATVHADRVRAELGSEPGPELEREVASLRENGDATGPSKETASQARVSHAAVDEAPSMPPTRGASRRIRPVLAIASLVAVVLVALAIRQISNRRDASNRRVVIASFDNRTGDSTLDDLGRIAADDITEQLTRAGFVDVADPATALYGSREVHGALAHSESKAALERLAKNARARLVVTGNYYREGDSLVAQARVTDVVTNEVLAATQPVRAPFGKQELLIQPLRERVMGALALRVDPRLTAVVPPGPTPTYEAYREFITGLEIFTTGRFRFAVPHFRRAYTLDTTFIEPLVWEAGAVAKPRLRQIVEILDRRSADLSQIDRYALDYNRALVNEDLEKALTAASNAARLSPGSHWSQVAATLLFRLGRFDESLALWAKVDREHGWLRRSAGVWNGYVWTLHDAGRHREELDRVREARALFPESLDLQQDEATALAMNHRWDDLNVRLDSLELRSPQAVLTVATELRVHGDLDHAKAVFGRCARMANLPAPHAVDAADFQEQRIHLLYSCSQWSDVARVVDSISSNARQPSDTPSLWLMWRAGARAHLGDRGSATALLDSLRRDSTSIGNGDRFVAAQIAAVVGDRARAVSLLEPLRYLPGDWLHRNLDAGDFISLAGFAPYERLRAGH